MVDGNFGVGWIMDCELFYESSWNKNDVVLSNEFFSF